MELFIRYLRPYRRLLLAGMIIKLFGTLAELSIPYILEHIIDRIVPAGRIFPVLLWGFLMIFMAFVTAVLNITANRRAVDVSSRAIYDLRGDFFRKTMHLSGTRFDAFGLPSLQSRMTTDSYNVQNFMARMQTMGVRTPIMLIGGILVTMIMDPSLSLILIVLVPLLIAIVILVSLKGVPLFDKVQRHLDDLIRIMRENISGIRVVKALSREDHERDRFNAENDALTQSDILANTIMAIPGPSMQLFLNGGLSFVVYFGALRVNSGQTRPGVILAFLTYFNLIMMSVMGLNRIFVMFSKAKASADRMQSVLSDLPDQPIVPDDGTSDDTGALIEFRNVDFNYFVGTKSENALTGISFRVKEGDSLGILGPTGSGKSTILHLLMRFYDCTSGKVLVDGRDVRSYDKDELRRMFGVVFQNDIIFADTISENISFGRDVDKAGISFAAEAAMAKDFIEEYPDSYLHKAQVKGVNFSGGQKQRILIARALAAKPRILILDDASSALDYRTDAALRRNLRNHYADTTMLIVAQRISSIKDMSNIIVLDNGRIIASGTHEELLAGSPYYRQVYESQMGSV